MAGDGIVIVGAGIAGLTLALELGRRGIASTILERASRLEEVGAGLQLSANALRVLWRLGLRDALDEVGTAAASVTLRDARGGRRIARVPVTGDDGTPYLALHRADLQAALLAAAMRTDLVTLRLGAAVSALSLEPDHVRLQVNEAGGDRDIRAALVVGADGVRSTIAHALRLKGPDPAVNVAWRATIDTNDGAADRGGVEAWLGPRRHAVAYPISRGRRTNLVLIEPVADGEDAAGLAQRFADWDPRLRAMIAEAGGFTAWPLQAVASDRPWRHLDDRVALIGDAAHAMPPYAAQGAGMAIEDAAVLAAALAAAPDRHVSLARYESERRERIDRLRRRVAFHRFVYHLPRPLSLGRNALLALRDPESLRRDLAWLYDWRPPE
ncbi:FAD-dependent monooxygenase [Aurantimonas sp. HBX-1]|uniref:FAD-dependent monooxygenase n=1 Tax=Aurantimonas sp. HBX-1 TaxID=2906072 RepID=UPI001F249FE3|nr:FAD-dependent monooxygenase [Aurantimonas sp. HBX-1]UIJ73874.1 FAD-dependent monooxygenase [Aurantimonas sp. HBX-1]